VRGWNGFTGTGSNNEDGSLSYINARFFLDRLRLTTCQKPYSKDLPTCCHFGDSQL
jgi:hypothetical protein